jgi:steroid 5-alpha reductase family enzyme
MTAWQFIAALVAMSATLSLIMTGAWLIQQRTGNSGWVDTTWAFGLGLVGAGAALVPLNGPYWQPRQIIVAVFAIVWAVRLGIHIASRSAKITDDPRYAELIKGWGSDAPEKTFWLLQKQALVSIPLALSMFFAAHHPEARLTAQDAAAVLVMLIAVLGEGAADWQLQRFKSDPANKGGINDIGLWRWSRHPNYFFETFGWLAHPLLAIDLSGGYPWGWLALAGPVCMYWLLVYVSGIPPLEEHMLRTRGEKFRAYQRRTNAFFPAPPHHLGEAR